MNVNDSFPSFFSGGTKLAQFGVVCVCARGNRIEGKTIRENLRAKTAEKVFFVRSSYI